MTKGEVATALSLGSLHGIALIMRMTPPTEPALRRRRAGAAINELQPTEHPRRRHRRDLTLRPLTSRPSRSAAHADGLKAVSKVERLVSSGAPHQRGRLFVAPSVSSLGLELAGEFLASFVCCPRGPRSGERRSKSEWPQPASTTFT